LSWNIPPRYIPLLSDRFPWNRKTQGQKRKIDPPSFSRTIERPGKSPGLSNTDKYRRKYALDKKWL
jgi:hypothetical protein